MGSYFIVKHNLSISWSPNLCDFGNSHDLNRKKMLLEHYKGLEIICHKQLKFPGKNRLQIKISFNLVRG
jgi:hypothetical protein